MLPSLGHVTFKCVPLTALKHVHGNRPARCACGKKVTHELWWENARGEMSSLSSFACDGCAAEATTLAKRRATGGGGARGHQGRHAAPSHHGAAPHRCGGGGAQHGSPLQIAERKEIGAKMSHWHASMSDPIYAVGSFYVNGLPYPQVEVVARARENLARDLGKAKRREHGWGANEVRELTVILAYLDRVLGKKPSDKADLTTMLQAYMEAAVADSDDEDGRRLGKTYSADDFTRDARADMLRDVTAFAKANAADIGDHWSSAGSDFWLSRNGGGTGFFDREHVYGEEQANRLQAAARRFGSSYVYVEKKKLLVG